MKTKREREILEKLLVVGIVNLGVSLCNIYNAVVNNRAVCSSRLVISADRALIFLRENTMGIA